MSEPIFLHVMSNGDLWISGAVADIPSGTVTATYKINSGAKFQKMGTLSGTCNSNLTATGATGKTGIEKS